MAVVVVGFDKGAQESRRRNEERERERLIGIEGYLEPAELEVKCGKKEKKRRWCLAQ
jgi:hypothetical protein